MSKIDDVAKLANVSKGTVSNVFSRKRPISAAVAERVLEASKQLNYIPNHIARSLATKQTMTIGLHIPFVNHIFFNSFQTHIISGITSHAATRNYRILLDTISQQDLDLPNHSSLPMDGAVIIDPTKEDERIKLLHGVNMPFVVIGKPSNSDIEEFTYVDNDNVQIGYDTCKYLIEKGHKHIMFLNAPEAMTVSVDRKKGFEKAFEEHHVEQQSYFHHFKPSLKQESVDFGYNKTLEMLGDLQLKVTAIIADDDQLAMGVLRALSALKLAVPEEMSLIVISGDPSIAQKTEPLLTTMDLRPFYLGEMAVNMLFRKLNIAKGTVSNETIVQASIIEKGSCRSIIAN
ncbi:DNA-binding LacI/PurR family transcriptional regulator [Paenibacillus endophyticus]|uniref:DNA-binding LacI/PurR family transcriptional regulator n=1 Tax=Paenibacillus endophyticus TaxID=1294268 RepID=A0A7W5CET6_9BACL|nr:LacI family DNA-binding transcriptional regulator [Paenibacillus endophyticus]MBB3155569.1 DNA-binding LacI/PurR family transcriptional regulator [Paenibacillus endophyticus]